MAKLQLSDVGNILGNPTSAQNTINKNNDLIEAALENTLSRDGETPNQMLSDLDMNENDVLNVKTIDARSLVLNGQTIIPGETELIELPPEIMITPVYDPQGIEADVFDLVNMTGTLDGSKLQVGVVDFDSKIDVESSTIPTGFQSIFVRGLESPGDGLSGIFTKTDNGSTDTVSSQDGAIWYREKNNIINVLWFGAKGDGVTDDGPAIQSALDLAEIHRSSVFLPAGTYLTGQELRQPSYTHVYGSGIDKTFIKASGSLSRSLNVLTNKKNTKLSRTDYDVHIKVSDLTVDGNFSERLTGTVIGGTGSNISFSTVRFFKISSVRSVNSILHNLDILASVYLNDGNVNNQPLGPSLDGVVENFISENPWYDDAVTIHNSGRITFRNCISLFDRNVITSPNIWQYGFESDEGSYDIHFEDCYAKGFIRGFAAKGHPQTHGSQWVGFSRCTAEECGQGFWIFHSNSSGLSNNYGTTLRDCKVVSPKPEYAVGEPLITTDSSYLIDIAQTRQVEISNLTLVNPGLGTVKLGGADTIGVIIDGVHIFGSVLVDTNKLGIFNLYGSLSTSSSVSISNVRSYVTLPRPAVRIYDGDGKYTVEKIDCNGSDNSVGLVHVPTTLNVRLCLRDLVGTGWSGLVHDESVSRGYSDYYRQELGEMRYVSIASGSPEGVVYAPPGTICVAYRSGNSFKKNATLGNVNTGWVAF